MRPHSLPSFWTDCPPSQPPHVTPVPWCHGSGLPFPSRLSSCPVCPRSTKPACLTSRSPQQGTFRKNGEHVGPDHGAMRPRPLETDHKALETSSPHSPPGDSSVSPRNGCLKQLCTCLQCERHNKMKKIWSELYRTNTPNDTKKPAIKSLGLGLRLRRNPGKAGDLSISRVCPETQGQRQKCCAWLSQLKPQGLVCREPSQSPSPDLYL